MAKLNFKSNSTDRPKGSEHLMFGHLGNGITVWDTTKKDQTNFDYVIVANINEDRVVKFYTNCSVEDANFITLYAKTANPRISSTQAQEVFKIKAVKNVYYFTFGYGMEYQGMYVEIEAYSSEEARQLMIAKYGTRWSFQYNEKEWEDDGKQSLAEKWGWTKLEQQ